MDIQREGIAEAKRRKRMIYIILGVGILAVSAFGLNRLEPAAPSVDRATVWLDQVKQGDMLRQVRGPGTLVPEEIRFISVSTEGTVERIVILPGPTVEPDTVLIELSNPQLEQAEEDADSPCSPPGRVRRPQGQRSRAICSTASPLRPSSPTSARPNSRPRPMPSSIAKA